ncbi:MAG: hypothetical protein ACI9SK_001927 [Zhongshania sp.]|jgi:hypothetical protein
MEYYPVRPNKFQVNRQLPSAWLISTLGISILLSVILNVAIAHSDDVDDLPVVKIAPQIRTHQLQQNGLSCEHLVNAETRIQTEQRELAQRKQKCLRQYQQFISKKALK